MLEITQTEMNDARTTLRNMGVRTRHDEEGRVGMAAVLGYIGQCLKYAVMLVDDVDAGPAAVRRAVAFYTAWEQLPATAALSDLPRDFSPPTPDVLEKLLTGLKETL
jgi:hypothetical protein